MNNLRTPLLFCKYFTNWFRENIRPSFTIFWNYILYVCVCVYTYVCVFVIIEPVFGGACTLFLRSPQNNWLLDNYKQFSFEAAIFYSFAFLSYLYALSSILCSNWGSRHSKDSISAGRRSCLSIATCQSFGSSHKTEYGLITICSWVYLSEWIFPTHHLLSECLIYSFLSIRKWQMWTMLKIRRLLEKEGNNSLLFSKVQGDLQVITNSFAFLCYAIMLLWDGSMLGSYKIVLKL